MRGGWGKETASDRPYSPEAGLCPGRFHSDSRGAETGKHHLAGGTVREPTSLAQGERCIKERG